MVSISAPQPICHKAMAGKIVIFTCAAIAKPNSATAGLQCTNTLNILTSEISFFVDRFCHQRKNYRSSLKILPSPLSVQLCCKHFSSRSHLSNNHLYIVRKVAS